jgi:hypothetical protein
MSDTCKGTHSTIIHGWKRLIKLDLSCHPIISAICTCAVEARWVVQQIESGVVLYAQIVTFRGVDAAKEAFGRSMKEGE